MTSSLGHRNATPRREGPGVVWPSHSEQHHPTTRRNAGNALRQFYSALLAPPPARRGVRNESQCDGTSSAIASPSTSRSNLTQGCAPQRCIFHFLVPALLQDIRTRTCQSVLDTASQTSSCHACQCTTSLNIYIKQSKGTREGHTSAKNNCDLVEKAETTLSEDYRVGCVREVTSKHS